MEILKSNVKNPFPLKVKCNMCRSKIMIVDIDDVRNAHYSKGLFWKCAACGAVNPYSIRQSNKILAWFGSVKRKRENNND